MEDADDLRVVIPVHTDTLNADDRGRVNLGTDYAGERVRVAVLEVVDADGGEDD